VNKNFSRIVESFSFSPASSALWRKRGGLLHRELGLSRASAETMTAHHYRANGAPVVSTDLGAPAAPFLFVLVLAGELKIVKGEKITTLGALDTWCRYGVGESTTWSLSHTTDIIMIKGAPAAATVYGAPDREHWIVTREAEEAYMKGKGPREFFSYRDLGIAAATNRRIHIQLVRAEQSVEGGTGWHFHTMGQLFFVIRGCAELLVEDAACVRMVPGDAMCIAAGMRHDVAAFSRDYFLLEMCIPADYDTQDAPSPTRDA